MNYLKIFKLFEYLTTMDNRVKLESPKVIGKIDPLLLKGKSRPPKDGEVPRTFREEIILKVDKYLSENPNLDSDYCIDWLKKILDDNFVSSDSTISRRVNIPQAKEVLDDVSFFKFDKYYKCYVSIRANYLRYSNGKNGFRINNFYLYGPIKGETGHGDFYFCPCEGEFKYLVFTTHFIRRYYERGISSKPMGEKEKLKTLELFFTDVMDNSSKGIKFSNGLRVEEGEIKYDINNGHCMGHRYGDVIVFNTYYPPAYLKNKR